MTIRGWNIEFTTKFLICFSKVQIVIAQRFFTFVFWYIILSNNSEWAVAVGNELDVGGLKDRSISIRTDINAQFGIKVMWVLRLFFSWNVLHSDCFSWHKPGRSIFFGV